MAIIKRTLKYGTALGVTYLSVEQRLWSELSHKQIKDKLAVVSAYGQKAEKFVVKQTGVDVSQWRPTSLHSLEPKILWNRSVKSVFKTIADIRVNELMAKIQKMVNTTTK